MVLESYSIENKQTETHNPNWIITRKINNSNITNQKLDDERDKGYVKF